MKTSKKLQISHNVTLRVLDKVTGKLVRESIGHNSATNTLIEGIGHYLAGEGVLNQGYSMLSSYIPKYISLGTMGLYNQDEDSEGLPTGLSGSNYTGDEATDLTNYMNERPGYGADGYSQAYNNHRPYLGLGPAFSSFEPTQSYYDGDIVYYQGKAYVATEDMIVDPESGTYNYWNTDKWELVEESKQPICWELISPSFPRQNINFRDVVPEYESENPKTIDVIFSAMISSGALAQFRDSNKDYVFVTEAGLWASKQYYPDGTGANGLVAGYRIVPPDVENWAMSKDDVSDSQAVQYLLDQGITNPTDEQILQAKIDIASNNRLILKQQILRVERGQVVQVIWKIEIGNVDEEGDGMANIKDIIEELYRLIGNKILYAQDVSVPASRWHSSGRSDYPYTAEISVPGIDSTYVTTVEFADVDVMLYEFGALSRSSTDTVNIYCKTRPAKTITLPIIIGCKGTNVAAS